MPYVSANLSAPSLLGTPTKRAHDITGQTAHSMGVVNTTLTKRSRVWTQSVVCLLPTQMYPKQLTTETCNILTPKTSVKQARLKTAEHLTKAPRPTSFNSSSPQRLTFIGPRDTTAFGNLFQMKSVT